MLFVPDISILQCGNDLWFCRRRFIIGHRRVGQRNDVARPTLELLICNIAAPKRRMLPIFTVVTFRRRKILCEQENRELLRTAFHMTKMRHPFTIDVFVLLPEHLHCIWTLPPGDKDYSMRWNAIKGNLPRYCLGKYKTSPFAAQKHKRAQTVWQPRFWEHQIRDERDYEKHCDYIHWNPVKQGLVSRVSDWPYSSFHRFVRHGNIRQIGPGHQKTMPIFPIMNVGNNAHLLSRGRAHAFLARHFGVSIW